MQQSLGLTNRLYLKKAIIIFCVALLLRGLFLALVSPEPERLLHRDSDSYIKPAFAMLAGQGFSLGSEPPVTPYAVRTPVYPLFIAAMYTVTGENLLVPAGVQVVLSAIIVALTYFLGRQLLSDEEAYLSGWLVAFSLTSMVYALYLMTETLFTLLFLAMNLALLRYYRSGKTYWLVITGGLAGVSILCRPAALFYPFVVMLLLLLFDDRNWRKRAQAAVLSLLVTVAVVAPWVIRNYLLLGIPTVSTISSYNLLYYNAVSLEAEVRGLGETDVRTQMYERVNEVLEPQGIENNPDEAGAVQLYQTWARDIILTHPFLYAYIHLKSDLNSLLPSITEFFELLGVTQGGKGTLSVLNQHGVIAATQHYFGDKVWVIGLVLPLLALLGLTYLGAVIGVGLLIKRKDWFTLFLLLMPLLYFLLLPGAPSHPRFRVPVMPYLCLLAGIGLWQLWWLVRQKKKLNS